MSLSGQIILSSRGRMPRFTGIREEQYETLKSLRSVLGRDVYAAALSDLERREARGRREADVRRVAAEAREAAAEAARRRAEAVARVAAAQRAEASRLKKNEKARARRAAQRTATDTTTGLITTVRISRGADPQTERNTMLRAAQRLTTVPTARFLLIVEGETYKEETVTIRSGMSSDNIYWSFIFKFLNRGSDEYLPEILFAERTGLQYMNLVITTNTQVPEQRLAQRFRDGPVHCIIDPLVSLWKKMGENSDSDSSRKRCFQVMRKIEGLRSRFAAGVPEADMEEVARIAQRKIVIKDLFGKSFAEYNAKSTKTFSWTNTRENHVDVGHLALQGQAEKCSQEEFDVIYTRHAKAWEEKKEVFLIEGSADGVRCIRSASGAWRVRDDLFDAFQEVRDELELNEFGFDCIKHPEVNEYIREACVVNSAPVRLSSSQPTGHRDLAAAYTQHEMTRYYQGFLGKIQVWGTLSVGSSEAKAFLTDPNHFGIFRCKVLSCDNELLARLGLRVGETTTLPSPEWLYFLDHGVKVEIVSGVVGSKWYGGEVLYEGLMEPIGDVKKPYAHLAGCFGHQNDTKTYKFHGSREWASHLKSCGYQTYYDLDMISVKVPADFCYTSHHILAFITSYTRINMLEAMAKFPIENLCAVVLDGIYFTGECPSIGDKFKEKKVKPLNTWGQSWYKPSFVDDEFMDVLDETMLLGNCILAGQGGCGKTHFVMTQSGLNDILYIVPQHTLGIENAQKHGVRYTTIHKFIGAESKDKDGKVVKCRPWKDEHTMPAIGFIDEGTMIDAKWISDAISMYPHTRFFIAADVMRLHGKMIAFQCRSGRPGHFNNVIDNDLPIKYFLNDRRSLDDQLKAMKTRIREEMVRIYTDGETWDAIAMANWISQTYPVMKLDDVAFVTGDTVIAGTHKTNDRLLEKGIVSGYLSAKKERSKEFVEGWTARGSFTTHSYQGSTIRDGRVFVCINDSFELAMIYTAVSRAVRIEQINFVVV